LKLKIENCAELIVLIQALFTTLLHYSINIISLNFISF